MMLVMWYAILLLPHLFKLVQPLDCNSNQYPWPNQNPARCCKKCDPGYYMVERCVVGGGDTKCKECERNYYIEQYNNELECKRCTECRKENMLHIRNCTKSHNSKCGCERQYKCNNDRCDYCEKIPPTPPPPPTTTSTRQTTTTATITTTTTSTAGMAISSKTNEQTSASRESVWISLTLCCACVCILLTCLILISRHTSAYGRLMLASTDCFWTSKKGSSQFGQCTEEVPMPVQEVCNTEDGEGRGWQEKVWG